MADEFVWNSPVITVKEIRSILRSQYGPEECQIRILFEDETKKIKYRDGLLNCECMRCGRHFNMAPSGLLNSIYFNGFICTGCGTLSDEELKARQEEKMRVAGIELLKEHGIDVVKEAIDDMNKKSKGETDSNEEDYDSDDIDMSEFDLSVNDPSTSTESMTPENETVVEETKEVVEESENVEEDDMSKYMASDEDYSSSIEIETNNVEDNTETEDIGDDMADDSSNIIDIDDNGTDIDTIIEDDGGIYEDEEGIISEESVESTTLSTEDVDTEQVDQKQIDFETEKAKAVEEAKLEVQKKADEEKAVYEAKLKAEMEAKIEAEKAKAAAEIEAARKAKEEAERFAADVAAEKAELEAKITEEQQQEPSIDEYQERVDEGERESQKEKDEEVEEEPEPEIETSVNVKIKDKAIHLSDDEVYTDDKELSDEIIAVLNKMASRLHFMPYDINSFKLGVDKIYTKCKTCHKEVSFESLKDLGKLYNLKEFASIYGLDISSKRNNLSGKETLIINCPFCVGSLIKEKKNIYHEKTVKSIANRSNFSILNEDKHLFIHDMNEEYECSCNGVVRKLKYSDMISRYCGKDAKDARKDDLFKPKENEASKSVESNKPTIFKSSESKGSTSTEEVTGSSQNLKEYAPTTKYVLRPKSMESKIKENEDSTKEETTTTSTSNKPNIFKKPRSEYDASMFDSDKAKDSFSDMEFERKRKDKNEKRNNIFVGSPSLKVSKSEVAKLNGFTNPFEREKSLKQEFEETVFADFIDQLSDRTGIPYKIVLNETSYEIPIIDFESGIRIICANLDEPG